MVSTGDRLRAMVSDEMDPRTVSLLVEAGRIADRLDQLDGIISGKSEWIELMHFRVRNADQQAVTVTVDGVLSEARQQAGALKAILAQVGVPRVEATVADKGSGVDQLRARRAARAAQRAADAAGAASP